MRARVLGSSLVSTTGARVTFASAKCVADEEGSEPDPDNCQGDHF